MNTQIRIGHLSPDAPAVNVIAGGETVLENVSFGQISDYLTVDDGRTEIGIVPASGGDAVLERTIDLDDDAAYTVLAVGELDELDALVLTDDSEPAADRTQVRFVHASPDAPAVDVQVDDGPTLFRNVAFGEASDYIGVDAATYDIDVMPADSDDVVLSLSDLVLRGESTVTVFGIGLVADDSLDAVVVEDRVSESAARTAAGR